MNSLSWILYLSDVSGSVRWVAIIAIILGGIATGIPLLAYPISLSDEMDDASAKDIRKWAAAVLRSFLPIVLVSFCFYAFLPTQQTLMLIAASEAGESILTSDKAREVGGEAGDMLTDSMKLLHKYIQAQLGDTAPKTDAK